MNSRPGTFTLLEIVPVVSVIAVLIVIAMTALRPILNFQKSRNEIRRADLASIADGVSEYLRDEGESFFISVPTAPASIEICADVKTGSCTNLLSLQPLLGEYLAEIPTDPHSEDGDDFNEHSRYFVERTSGGRLRFFAPDTEPQGAMDIAIER